MPGSHRQLQAIRDARRQPPWRHQLDADPTPLAEKPLDREGRADDRGRRGQWRLRPDGPGASDGELAHWRQAIDRFGYNGPLSLGALYSFPHPPAMQAFFTGESYEDLHAGRRNPVANPLELIRPFKLTSSAAFCREAQLQDRDPTLRQDRTKQSQGGLLEEVERAYLDLVVAFERAAHAVLATLNEPDRDARLVMIQAAFADCFPRQLPAWPRPRQAAWQRESPRKWLLYAVLSIVNHPSDGITPVGRVRALELLQQLDAAELAGLLRDPRGGWALDDFTSVYRLRIPYPFTTRDERLQDHTLNLLFGNQAVARVLVQSGAGAVDWTATANRLIEQAPEAAIQLAIDFLCAPGIAKGAVAFLQAVPSLDRGVLGVMFGPRATFRIEHQLARGVDEAVLVGTGLLRGPSDGADEDEALSPAELRQQLRRRDARIDDLEQTLALADAARAALAWQLTERDQVIARQAAELAYWRAGSRPPDEPMAAAPTATADRLDPKGHYRRLGAHPALFQDQAPEEEAAILKRLYRLAAQRHHPDAHGDEETWKAVEEAYAVLSNPTKRQQYDKGRL